MIAVRLGYFENDRLASRQRAIGIVRIHAVTGHHGPPGIGRRIIHEEIPVRGECGVKCKTQQPLFVALVADPASYIEKNFAGGSTGTGIENLDDPCLLDHENPVRAVPGRLKIHGTGETEVRKRLLKL